MTKSLYLDDRADRSDPAISDDWNTKPPCILGHLVHGRALGAAARHNFLCDADATTAHANAESVGTGVNEVLGLRGSDNIACNHVEVGVCLLDVPEQKKFKEGVGIRVSVKALIVAFCRECRGEERGWWGEHNT